MLLPNLIYYPYCYAGSCEMVLLRSLVLIVCSLWGSPGVEVSTKWGACMVPYRGDCVGLRVVYLEDWLFELGRLACCSAVSLALQQTVESP